MTLGALTAVRGLARLMGGDTTIFNPDLAFSVIGNGSIGGLPWLVVIAASIILVSWFILRWTVLGVRIYAVGGNPDAAQAVRHPRVAGASLRLWPLGSLCRSRRRSRRPPLQTRLQLGQSYELDAIAAVILGGTSFVGGIGSIWGTAVGSLIIAVMSNGLTLSGVSDVWQSIVKGLVIIGAVLLDRYRLAGGART